MLIVSSVVRYSNNRRLFVDDSFQDFEMRRLSALHNLSGGFISMTTFEFCPMIYVLVNYITLTLGIYTRST